MKIKGLKKMKEAFTALTQGKRLPSVYMHPEDQKRFPHRKLFSEVLIQTDENENTAPPKGKVYFRSGALFREVDISFEE